MTNSLRIITNFNCNQKCKFCYQKRWDKNYISVSDIENKLKKLNMNHETFNNITVMGGEPTLNPNLTDILYYLRKKN